MPSPVADFLEDLSLALDAMRVRWYLFGAQAALLYGASRLTADVDITIHFPAGLDTTMLADGLNIHGFQVRITNPAFIAQTRVLPVVHAASSLPADLVIAGPGPKKNSCDGRPSTRSRVCQFPWPLPKTS